MGRMVLLLGCLLEEKSVRNSTALVAFEGAIASEVGEFSHANALAASVGLDS